MGERDGLTFGLELHEKSDAFPVHGVAEAIRLEPASVKPLAHFGHQICQVFDIAADFDRIHDRRTRHKLPMVERRRKGFIWAIRGVWRTVRRTRLFPRLRAAS